MSELLKTFQCRRSVRTFTGETVTEEQLKQILQAGLMSATGKGIYPCEFIVIKDRPILDRMKDSRDHPVAMLDKAALAIAVVADKNITDTYIEDSSIAMANMHLMASSLGLGSCWVQSHLRKAADGRSTEEYLRELLGFPDTYHCEAFLVVGVPSVPPVPHDMEKLKYEKIHREHF